MIPTLLADASTIAMGWAAAVVGMLIGAALIGFPSKRQSPSAENK